MKLQKTDTTNRLNTLPQTKKIAPRVLAPICSCIWNSGMKASMPTMQTAYTAGTNWRRFQRAAMAPNSGTSASEATNVAA